jgi:hypothetical protein
MKQDPYFRYEELLKAQNIEGQTLQTAKTFRQKQQHIPLCITLILAENYFKLFLAENFISLFVFILHDLIESVCTSFAITRFCNRNF